MLALVSFGYFAVLIGMTGIAPAFPFIARELEVDYQRIALLATAFLAGLAAGHIPSGMLATRVGMKRVLVMGVLVQALANAASAFVTSYAELLALRFVVGLGASAFASVAVAAISAWFEKREITLALGIATASNSTGTAVGLYMWTFLVEGAGWRVALAASGIVGTVVAVAMVFAFRTPAHLTKLRGTSVTTHALRQTLGNRQLWIYGVAFIGVYGAYMSAVHLISGYATSTGKFSATAAGLMAAFIGLAGIPGSIVGGWVADRTDRCRRLMIGPMVAIGLLVVSVPFVAAQALWLVSIGIGFLMQFTAAVWSSVPHRFARIPHEHAGTGMGLLLTIAAVGGFLIPAAFGHLVETAGYVAGWAFAGAMAVVLGLVGLFGADVVDGQKGGQ